MTFPRIAVLAVEGEDGFFGGAVGWSPVAAVDLPDPFRFVTLEGSETIVGVLQEPALEDESCDVVFQGVSQVEAGEAFSAGEVLAGDGVGRAVKVLSSPAKSYLAAAAALALTDAADVGSIAWALVGPRPQRVGPYG